MSHMSQKVGHFGTSTSALYIAECGQGGGLGGGFAAALRWLGYGFGRGCRGSGGGGEVFEQDLAGGGGEFRDKAAAGQMWAGPRGRRGRGVGP